MSTSRVHFFPQGVKVLLLILLFLNLIATIAITITVYNDKQYIFLYLGMENIRLEVEMQKIDGL